MKKYEIMRAWLCQAINSFQRDPPDSAYQRGYLAALHECLAEIDRIREEESA